MRVAQRPTQFQGKFHIASLPIGVGIQDYWWQPLLSNMVSSVEACGPNELLKWITKAQRLPYC
jgi:hypothetical protein